MNNKPNILFILADDMGAWAMRNAGNPDVITPHLDGLAREGIRFDNFFCVSPVCSPARASILTGTIPSRHGIHDWLARGNIEGGQKNKKKFYESRLYNLIPNCRETVPQQYLHNITTYTSLLAQVGYQCCLSGKWHLGDSCTPQQGFERWYTIATGGGSYMNPRVAEGSKICYPEKYITDLITENAVVNLNQCAGSSRPFYLSVHYTAPHSPWDKHEHPADVWALYEGNAFGNTPEEKEYHPCFTFSAPFGRGDKRKALLRGYYSAITAMDAGIGKIIEALKSNGLYDNTIIIFTSDNGMNMGHHGLFGKGNATFPQNMYDTSVKVPFLVCFPKAIRGGRTICNLYSHYDLMPTLMDYLDLQGEVIQKLPGRSFADILRGKEAGADTGSIVAFSEYGYSRMIRNKRYKLITRGGLYYDEFYDLENDPGEKNNLIKDKRHRETIGSLQNELDGWFLEFGDRHYDGRKYKVLGHGQLYDYDCGKKARFTGFVIHKNPLRAARHIAKYRTRRQTAR
ncbi:MAG TPA: sulfatase-like hydrolase/transferase [Clostridiales bacterium]|nr:sulfatase-like hydrolase/transferase [Clostridiales bacterium]HQH62539.1 sulfatase-like hydrolase/transferase [Clostridiales bacterium]HQK73455.1 sulfatase-like hydrolase/transferase [Clostridiales bacterium]